MDERIKSIVEMIEKLESRLNVYWNFYIVLVIAIIGWLMSAKTPFTTNQAIALTIALCMFFIASYSVIRAATRRVIAFEDELNLLSKKKIEFNSNLLKSNLANKTIQYRLLATAILHLTMDAAVIFGIWNKLL